MYKIFHGSDFLLSTRFVATTWFVGRFFFSHKNAIYRRICYGAFNYFLPVDEGLSFWSVRGPALFLYQKWIDPQLVTDQGFLRLSLPAMMPTSLNLFSATRNFSRQNWPLSSSFVIFSSHHLLSQNWQMNLIYENFDQANYGETSCATGSLGDGQKVFWTPF